MFAPQNELGRNLQGCDKSTHVGSLPPAAGNPDSTQPPSQCNNEIRGTHERFSAAASAYGFGTVADQRDVSPDSKPSANTLPGRKTITRPSLVVVSVPAEIVVPCGST